MATATHRNNSSPTLSDYIRSVTESDPAAALELAIKETERVQAEAALAREENKALSDVEFDDSGLIKKANMAGLWRLSQIYAGSKIVPEHYQDNINNCFIACQMAFRCKVDPLAYMQSSYIVHGRPGIEGKFAVAMLNTSGKIDGRIEYEFSGQGPTRSCTATARDKASGRVVRTTIDWKMVEAEGWNKDKKSKNSDFVQKSKWNTIPEQMFQYRAATFLIRANYPEVLMGMRLVEELDEIHTNETAAQSPRPSSLDALTDKLTGSKAKSEPQQETHQDDQRGAINSHFAPQETDERETVEVENPEATEAEAMSAETDPYFGLDELFAKCTMMADLLELEAAEIDKRGISGDSKRLAEIIEPHKNRIRTARTKK